MVRVQSLTGYRELVRELGGDSSRLLRKAGVRGSVLDQLTGFISFDSLIDLLEHSANDLGCTDFGLRLADRQDIGILGTLAVAVRNSETLGEATRCVSKYLSVHNPGLAFTLRPAERADQVLLDLEVLQDHASRWTQTAEHGIGLVWRGVRMLSEGRAQLRAVWLPDPAVSPLSAYRSRFDAPITFDSGRWGLAVDAAALDLTISGHNHELRDLATSYLAARTGRHDRTFAAQVRQVVEKALGTGRCSCAQVADAVYMHPRTLQRRLREEGTTFEAVKDEVRRDLAQRYLSQADVPLSQITALLDYSELSAFNRSCRRWFGATPSVVRTSGVPTR